MTYCHEADLDFAKEFAHKINNFDETWVENAQPGGVLIFQLFHINGHESEFKDDTLFFNSGFKGNGIYSGKYSADTVKVWPVPHMRLFGTVQHTNAM